MVEKLEEQKVIGHIVDSKFADTIEYILFEGGKILMLSDNGGYYRDWGYTSVNDIKEQLKGRLSKEEADDFQRILEFYKNR